MLLTLAALIGNKGAVAPPAGAAVRTDPAIVLAPTYPTAGVVAGDLFLAHTTVHADQNASASGATNGWVDVIGRVEADDLANIVEYKVATGSEAGTAAIAWSGQNGTGAPSTPILIGSGAAVSGANAAVDILVPYPAGTTILANDLLIIQFGIRDGTATTAVATGFTTEYTDVAIGNNTHRVMWKFAVGGESGTVAVNWDANATGFNAIGRMYVFRGVALTDFFEGGGVIDTTISGPTNTIQVPSVTTAGPNWLGVAFLSTVAVRTFDEISGETGGDWFSPVDEASSALGSGYAIGFNIAELPTVGTISGGSALITSGGTINWHSRSFALKPAGGLAAPAANASPHPSSIGCQGLALPMISPSNPSPQPMAPEPLLPFPV